MITQFTTWDGTNLKEVVEIISGALNKNKQILELGWDDYRRTVKLKGLSIETYKGWKDVGVGDKVIREGEHITVLKQT